MFNIGSSKKERKFDFNIKQGSKFLQEIVTQKQEPQVEIESEIFYRNNGTGIEKVVEKNKSTGQIIKVTNYDYFDDKKIKSIEDYEDGVKVKFTLYSFFTSVTEFDKKTEKKIRTTNYDSKKSNRKMSVYDYDPKTEKIVKMTVYRTDGHNIAFIKELSPETGIVTRCINYKKDSPAISSVSKYEMLGETTVKTTYYYTTPIYALTPNIIDKKLTEDTLNKKIIDSFNSKKVNTLIDNLYKNKQSFSSVNVS